MSDEAIERWLDTRGGRAPTPAELGRWIRNHYDDFEAGGEAQDRWASAALSLANMVMR